MKAELKETKAKKGRAEENLNEIKREQKRASDKASAHMEAKLRALEDMKKSADIQIASLQKANTDMSTKLQEERGGRSSLSHDLEVANKSVKRYQEQIKVLIREKDLIEGKLKEKQRELSVMSMSESLSEKRSSTTAGRVTAHTSSRRPSASSSVRTIRNSTLDSTATCTESTSSTRNSTPIDRITCSEGTDNNTAQGSAIEEGEIRKSKSFSDENSDVRSSPITRLIKDEALSGGKAPENVSKDDSFTGSPPPKRSTNIPRFPAQGDSAPHIPRYLQATKASSTNAVPHAGTGDSAESTSQSMSNKKDRAQSGIPSGRPFTRSRAVSASTDDSSATSIQTRSKDAVMKHQVNCFIICVSYTL